MHQFALTVVVLCFCVGVASAQTGYFKQGASGQDSTCPETDPCADPFSFIPSATFSEYVLAAGTYAFTSAVYLSRSFTMRKWVEKGEQQQVLLLGQTTSALCFSLSESAPHITLSFRSLTIECQGGLAFHFIPYQSGSLSLQDVIIQNSGGLFIENDRVIPTPQYTLFTAGLVIKDTPCTAALSLKNVDWVFGKVKLENHCNSVVLDNSSAISNGGFITFQRFRSSPVLSLYHSDMITDLATVEFLDNEVEAMVVMRGSNWRSTGLVSFERNSASVVFDIYSAGGRDTQLYSLIPLRMVDNQFEYTFITASTSDLCVLPCDDESPEYCDCIYQSLISWGEVTIEEAPSLVLPLYVSPPSPIDMELHLVLAPPDGVVHGQHFTLLPSPSQPFNDSSLEIIVNIPQGEEKLRLAITPLTALREAVTLTLRVPDGYFNPPFFLSANQMQAVLFPASSDPPVYKPEESTIAVTFPNANKADHTLFFSDERLQNNSVTAQFVALTEVDEDGGVVASVSLQDVEWRSEELGNTAFNLKNALPFISFSTEITSFLLPDGVPLNLTEAIRLELNFTMFEEAQVISFAGVEQVMAGNTLKWNVLLSSWPFQHQNHSLVLHLSVISEDGPVSLLSQHTTKEGVWECKLQTENTRVPMNVLLLAIVDGSPSPTRDVKGEWKEGKLMLKLPWFNHSLMLDPDMSLLLAEESDGEEDGEDGDDELWWKIVVPVVVVVVVAAAVVTLVVVWWQRRERRTRINQRSVVSL
ncbi:hypothetical protein QOT17_018081 [Balamuthia mandrillaris]